MESEREEKAARMSGVQIPQMGEGRGEMRDQAFGTRLLLAIQRLKKSGKWYKSGTLSDLLREFDCTVDEYEQIVKEAKNAQAIHLHQKMRCMPR